MNDMSAWEMHTRAVIGAMLADPEIIDTIAHGDGLEPLDLYGGKESPYGLLYSIILNDVYKEGLEVSPETVSAVTDKAWTVESLYDILYEAKTEKQARTSATLCKEFAVRWNKILVLREAIGDLENIANDRNRILSHVVREMSKSDAVAMKSTRIGDVFMDMVESYGKNRRRTIITPTGFSWLDSKKIMSGGLRTARFIGIGGEEKNRKTTLARNMVLGVLREKQGLVPLPIVEVNPVTGEYKVTQDKSRKIPYRKVRENVAVAFLAYENDREITTLDFIAMVMYEYMVYAKTSRKPWPGTSDKTMADYCDGETVQDALAKGDFDWDSELTDEQFGNFAAMIKHMPRDWQDALFYAFLSLRGANLHTYDRDKQYGGLRGFAEMNQVVNRFSYDYSDPNIHKVIVIDYAQLVKGNGSLFENMSQFASEGLEIAMNKNATVIALSQFSRQGKRDQRTMPMDVLYTKGGADLEQAVQNYFQVVYNNEERPTALSVIQRRARRGGGGMHMRQTYDIHPASGLMLKESATDYNPYA